MGLFQRLSGSFSHGVHPLDFKEQTVDLPIQRVPFGKEYIMPLGQHIGTPSIPIVRAGDIVRRGQPIAEATGFISTALHAPVTGRVSEIGERRYIDGSFKMAIVIEADPFSSQRLDWQHKIDWRSLNREAFIDQVQQAGMVGMGGAAFPSHVKYVIPEGQKINELLVNGAECEPYLTNDHRLMVEQPEKLLLGIEILLTRLEARHATIGVESNKPESIDSLNAALKKRPDLKVDVIPLKVKYPQGAEKMLIKSIYNREVPNGQLPRDIGITVNNVGTVVAIADYFTASKPLIERVVTVSGPGIASPANLIVPLGTPIREVLRVCGGLKSETREVLMGGPMMGIPIASLDAPILKGSSGILAFTMSESGRKQEYPCIHCGRCLEACPYFLNPSKLARLGKARMFSEMEEQFHVSDCVECGACTFACPSHIPIVQMIRSAKNSLRQHKQGKN